jgi:bifunctional non-homologous end joining protein LigD
MDLEGVMAKRLDSPYRPGARDVSWVKVKSERTADLVVGGWRPGAGTLGALLVGTMRLDGWLDYRGRVGVGISSADEMELLTALAADGIRRRSPFVGNVTVRTARFVLPKIVVEVRYGELLPDGKLRFARLARVRWDKTPVDTIGQL